MLDSLITSKTRLKLLIKFFVNSSNKGYLRGIAEEFNESTNSIRKELNQLTEAGYLIKKEDNNKLYYSANANHSLFVPLQNLVHKYLGIDKIIDMVLEKAGSVEQVLLLGDYAKGIDSGTIEVLLLGQHLDSEYLLQLSDKVANIIDKNIVLYFEKPSHADTYIILFQH